MTNLIKASRPFSKDRAGFVLGEGAWFFVLEPFEKAQARGAAVYGEIAGYGSTCEAYHRVRLEEGGEGAGTRHADGSRCRLAGPGGG